MSQKLENLLNLALDADQGERERSEELDVGYDKEENVWELIVKYSGTLEAVRQTAAIGYGTVERLCGYCHRGRTDRTTGSAPGSGIYRKTEKAVFSN